MAEINRERDELFDMVAPMPSGASITPTGADSAEPVESTFGIITELDIAEGIPAIEAPRSGVEALVLVRLFTEPLGTLTVALPVEGIGPDDLAREIVREFEPQLKDRFAECGLALDGELPVDGLTPPRVPSFLASRERVMREGPTLTAVVCTRYRPEGLPLLLASLANQEYQRMRILVVDNAPTDDRTRQLVLDAAKAHQIDIDYAVEPRPGLSWARNRSIEASDGEVIAWVDDDERCDRWWAAEIARAYVEVPEAGSVCGLMCPAEFVTEDQVLFENFNNMRRARGFTRQVFSPATVRQQSPLYPLPPFGAGGNMSFRRDAIEQIGGFDNALGAGTVVEAGEDTAVISLLLLAGGTVVWQPSALTHHSHRRDYAALRSQLKGYGRGLGGFYMSMIARRPAVIFDLLRLTRQAARDQFSSQGQRLSVFGDNFPHDLLRANRIGLLQGPFAYGAARLHARRLLNGVPKQ